MLLTMHALARLALTQVPTMQFCGQTPLHPAPPAPLVTRRLVPVVFQSLIAIFARLGMATVQGARAAPRYAEGTRAQTTARLAVMRTTKSAPLAPGELDSRSTFWPRTSFTFPTSWHGLAPKRRQIVCQSLHRSRIRPVSHSNRPPASLIFAFDPRSVPSLAFRQL